MISYIVDEDGNKTHVIIPIEAWEQVQNVDNKEKNSQIMEVPPIEDLCVDKHLKNLVPLVEGMELLSVEDWQKEYKEFFKYMEGLEIANLFSI